MTELTPTAAERATERFGAAALQRAVAALRADGFVVINDVVAHAHLDRLRERMTCDLEKVRALPVVPHNFVWGNIQQGPPPDAMIHTVAWYRRSARVELEEACAPVFAGCAIENAIPLVANPKDHLTGNAPYEYAGPN